MAAIRVSLLMLFLTSILFSPMGFAKSVSLKTITVNLPSPHGILQAEIHFDEKDLGVALKVEKIIKTDLIKAINYFQYVPENIVHFNVDPYLRLTNGNARVFPTNIINLYNFPPSNDDHLIVLEDWLRGLIFHEYVHITHLDQTRDYLEIGERIFGTFAKIPAGIVPRWFTEGIAVWAESHLMSGGRLNNPLFRKELLIQFLRIEYCKTIDCLDDPGVYPGGSLAYWAGAHFIEYIEEKKPGTVKCLIEGNSSNLPTLLNRIFEKCTGSDAQTLFTNFRDDMLANQPKSTPENEAWGDKISNAFGSDDLQKGILLDGNILYKVERDRSRQALLSYDLQENVNMMTTQFHFPIDYIAGITTMQMNEEEAGKYLVVAFNEDPYYRKDNRVWKLINAETLLLEAVLPLRNDPSYVIPLGNNRFITASFLDGSWRIEKQKVDFGKDSTFISVEPDLIQQFNLNTNLNFLQRRGDKIFLKLNKNDVTTLMVSDLTMEKFYKLHESKDFFDMPILTDKFLVIREKNSLNLIELDEKFKKSSKSELGKDLLNRVTNAELNDERVLVLENRLKTKAMSLKESLSFLKTNIGKEQTSDLLAVDFKEMSESITLENTNVESFPKLYHMRPHWWFLASGTSENLGSIGAMTSFSDPMDVYTANATLLFYEENKIGGNLDYLQKFSRVTDLWTMSAFFNQEYSKTSFSNYINETTEATLGTHYNIQLKRATLVPGIYLGGSKTQDFISERSTKMAGVSTVFLYDALSFDDYLQKILLQFKIQVDQPDIEDSFINTQMRFQTEGRFAERLEAGIKVSYGRLFKDGFSQGVIYGGGTTDLNSKRWFEFYGVPYSNAYGNEIFTFKLYLDYNLWYIYKGYGFFPFYLREAHLLLGRETLYADRIFLDNTIIREKAIHGFFAGPRLKTTLFYYVPADIDLIFSSVAHPNGNTINQVLFSINAEVF